MDGAGAADIEVETDVDVILALPLDVFTVDCDAELLVEVGPSSAPVVVACRAIKALALGDGSAGEPPHEPR